MGMSASGIGVTVVTLTPRAEICMKDEQTLAPPPLWTVRGQFVLAALAVISAAALLPVVVGFARQPRMSAAFDVLNVRLTTTTVSTSPQMVKQSTGELWIAPSLGRVREAPVSPPGPADYYVRDHSGAWTHVAYERMGSAGYWRWAATARPPSWLTVRQVDALFIQLRAGAGAANVSRVAMSDRMAATFTTRALSWPYRYSGLARVWIDDVTGQPRQIRVMTKQGGATVTILTTIDRMGVVPSTALPTDFFTPPDELATLWDRTTR